MGKSVFYFIGSGIHVGEETLEEVSKIKGFDKFYSTLGGGASPSDGYVAKFTMENERDVSRIRDELAKTEGVEELKMVLFGTEIKLSK